MRSRITNLKCGIASVFVNEVGEFLFFAMSYMHTRVYVSNKNSFGTYKTNIYERSNLNSNFTDVHFNVILILTKDWICDGNAVK